VNAVPSEDETNFAAAKKFSAEAVAQAAQQIAGSGRPVMLVGSAIGKAGARIASLAESHQCPVFTTTAGKGFFPSDHPLSFGCISRLGAVQEILSQSDLLISFGARLTEFDTGRFGLQLPARHIQVVEDPAYAGNRIPSTLVIGGVAEIADALAQATAAPSQNAQPGHVQGAPATRPAWCDLAAAKAREAERLQGLAQEGYAALQLLRAAMHRDDVLVNDQSILNYWASAFFPVFQPGTFLYPLGSGTLGYALPAAIGAAFALRQTGGSRRVVCVAGDGGFQYTQHELATLAQYGLPVKVLLVNDESYGIIGFLQLSMFGQTHEVALKNPDFCRVAEAYGIRAERVTGLDKLEQRLRDWLEAPGPALLEWRTVLKAPWETGAIPRPTGIAVKSS